MVTLIGRLVACSARISIDRETDRQTDKPSTVTLGVHAHPGVVGFFRSTFVRDTPCPTVICVSARKLLCCVFYEMVRVGGSASQCVNSPTEAARAHALLTAREARLPTNLRARRKLDFLRMTEVTLPFGD